MSIKDLLSARCLRFRFCSGEVACGWGEAGRSGLLLLSKLLAQLAAFVMEYHFHLEEHYGTNYGYLLDIWQLNFLKVNKVNLSLVAQIVKSLPAMWETQV